MASTSTDLGAHTTQAQTPYSNYDTRYAYSPALHFLTQLLVFVTLILPPSVPTWVRRLFFFPIAAIVYRIAFLSTAGDITTDAGIGPAVISQGVIALDFILLHDPRKELRRKVLTGIKHKKEAQLSNDDKSVDNGSPGNTLKQRIHWALSLLVNPRGYGWSFEPTPGILPPRPSPNVTRFRFILTQFQKIISCITIEVIAYLLNIANPAMHLENGIRGSDTSLVWRLIAVLGVGAAAYARINMMYCSSAVVTVILGISKPQAWPDLFGRLRDAWSVGRFWSRVWHQLIRRPLCSITDIILPLRFKSSLPAYSFLRLLVIFLASGAIHSAGEYMMLNHFSLGSLCFFIVQPFAIAFEKLLLFRGYGYNQKPAWYRRLLGYAFVLLWFTWAGPFLVDPMIKGGMFKSSSGNLGNLFMSFSARASGEFTFHMRR